MVSNVICYSHVCSSGLVSCPRCVHHENVAGQRLHHNPLLRSTENAVGVRVDPGDQTLLDKCKAETLVEKKTVINLLEAYAVAVKHYLRKEDGIGYRDLHPFVRFLPKYSLPSNIPSRDLHHLPPRDGDDAEKCLSGQESYSSVHRRTVSGAPTETSSHARHLSANGTNEASCELRPAENPRNNSVMARCKRLWHELRGDELPTQARSTHKVAVHNVPLEISFYLVSETPCY